MSRAKVDLREEDNLSALAKSDKGYIVGRDRNRRQTQPTRVTAIVMETQCGQ